MLESTFAFNSFTLNDDSKSGLSVSPFYWAELRSIDGLFGADISYESHSIPGVIGEKSGDVLRRGKTITFTGFLWGRNVRNMRDGQFALMQALADKAIHELVFTPMGFAASVYIKCRVSQDLVIVEQQDDLLMRRAFTFSLRADDPRIRKVSDDSVFPSWQA